MSALPLLHSYTQTLLFMCVSLRVSLILVPHLGKNAYMHQYMYLCPSNSHVCFTPLAYLHGNMGSSMWHCVCSSHSTSVLTPSLECVYVLVHAFMST